MFNFPTKITRNGQIISKKNTPAKEEGKHSWTWNEDLTCSKECIVEYVVEKRRTALSVMEDHLSAKLPALKKLSIHDKIQNIKQIFIELNVENTLEIAPLTHYSPQNMEAVVTILEGRGIAFKKNK